MPPLIAASAPAGPVIKRLLTHPPPRAATLHATPSCAVGSSFSPGRGAFVGHEEG